MLDGKWKGTSGDVNGGLKEGYVGIMAFSEKVPTKTRDLALSAMEKIKSDELIVYRGPIKDNKGNMVVKEGEMLPHEKVMAMDWLVEGIK